MRLKHIQNVHHFHQSYINTSKRNSVISLSWPIYYLPLQSSFTMLYYE